MSAGPQLYQGKLFFSEVFKIKSPAQAQSLQTPHKTYLRRYLKEVSPTIRVNNREKLLTSE